MARHVKQQHTNTARTLQYLHNCTVNIAYVLNTLHVTIWSPQFRRHALHANSMHSGMNMCMTVARRTVPPAASRHDSSRAKPRYSQRAAYPHSSGIQSTSEMVAGQGGPRGGLLPHCSSCC
eukprot:GHRQ01011638.1.p1 GENE.GHRQ01011638.1~~GHRQ01011638.1.p1  ORF type:complete len:121 (-),score=15.61 GHRQ01011638.1:1077-1439(-)